MEPNNFEKDFREKLNQREIEPSNKAWDRLDAMLSVAEEKKPKRNRKWLYIAASLIGFLLIGTLFFNQNKKSVATPETVIVEKETETKKSVTEPILNKADSVKTETIIAEKISEETVNKEKTAKSQISNKIIKNVSNQVAESSIIIKNNQEKESVNNQIQITETSKKENVDQLLETAENKVVAQNQIKKAKVKINANDLLNQVDGELELSFREKVITKVNKNLQEVKVAISNRNQQE
ncbi:MAG: hypothetical protein REI96_03935 [Flavobacterium nitrogenifigens]|uniref:Uncharacterized protein n=1 Tax=Flavobacterium nitrogenifigens TaxID=1617283 RepID=A0A521EXG9_9FLAO|nr:hypothetical protein [Flavobacterium nitrogenifigens]KAF2333294.1 hypothetical protein DM397_09095 [Flavobacterium nitrogenifigens]MDQ8011574.1 hypothetical protein [Flavobacterium nitrogenifigens]SMO88672.1 hypothetical protein SAMN06265220_105235 [Flavobacterium nitrogenifigens]